MTDNYSVIQRNKNHFCSMLIFSVMFLLFGLNHGYFIVTKRIKVDIEQKITSICLFDRRLPSESEVSEIKQLKFPVKTKDVISRLTQSTQIALGKKLSRIEIQLPPLFDLGLTERNPALKENETSRTNRELAKLFLEMFAVLKDSSAVIFPTLEEAKRAEVRRTSSRKRIFFIFPSIEIGNLYPKLKEKD